MEKGKSRKIFLSFLGLGGKAGYIPGNYIDKEKNRIVNDVKYVQNAIVEIEEDNFDEKYIFCTREVLEKRFDELEEEKGYKYISIEIGKGEDEGEIWAIFQKIYDVLEENDEVTFDVTHSYRFLPILGLLLLQHAKFLKNIKVKKLCYGAFEMKYKMKNENEEIDVSPIMDLTSFSKLQDWSLSGYSFVNTGMAANFTDLAKKEFKSTSKNIDMDKINLEKISKKLENIALDLYTNRGINIVEGHQIADIKKKMKEMKKDLYPPFTLVIDKMEKDISNFKVKNVYNVFYAVEWCIEKKLFQQGITMLQEGLITFLLDKVNIDYKNKENREEFSNFIGLENAKEYKGDIQKMNDIVSELGKKQIEFQKLKSLYCNIKNIRNDINHGGFNLKDNKLNGEPRSKMDSLTFKNTLEKNFKKIKEIIFNGEQEI
ncbi:TIGR02221 family CRISPR-associated protein [Leptotrichia sp.]